MTLGPVRVMGAGVVLMMCVIEVFICYNLIMNLLTYIFVHPIHAAGSDQMDKFLC